MGAGRVGRPAKPTQLKILHGDRKDRINTQEPKPADGDVVRPEWLDAPTAQVWDRLAPDLVAKGVLTAWDVDTFADLCSMVVVNREAIADLREHGTRIVTPVKELRDGTVVYSTTKNPNWQIAKETSVLLAAIGGRFGLNPSDRSHLKVGDDPSTGKPGEDLLSG